MSCNKHHGNDVCRFESSQPQPRSPVSCWSFSALDASALRPRYKTAHSALMNFDLNQRQKLRYCSSFKSLAWAAGF
jgi:hypothetical protein